MSSREKKFASKRYPNLFKYTNRSPNWIFRKYSAEKKKEFIKSTGEPANESRAYRIGLDAFNEWLGLLKDPVLCRTFRDFGQDYLQRKLSLPDSEFSVNSKRTTRIAMHHLLLAFGHLRIDQITEERWEDYWVNELKKKPQKFFNRRKALIEIMRKALRHGLITRLPVFPNPDTKSTAGKYLTEEQISEIFKYLSSDVRLLAEIMYRTGFRPGEVLQYKWEMFDFSDGPNGSIRIPAEITKTRREREVPLNSHISTLLKARKQVSTSAYVFPSPQDTNRSMKSYKTSWGNACVKAGFNARIYDLRHTFFTNAARANHNIVLVAKYADTSVKMIEDIYAKAEKKLLLGIAG